MDECSTVQVDECVTLLHVWLSFAMYVIPTIEATIATNSYVFINTCAESVYYNLLINVLIRFIAVTAFIVHAWIKQFGKNSNHLNVRPLTWSWLLKYLIIVHAICLSMFNIGISIWSSVIFATLSNTCKEFINTVEPNAWTAIRSETFVSLPFGVISLILCIIIYIIRCKKPVIIHTNQMSPV